MIHKYESFRVLVHNARPKPPQTLIFGALDRDRTVNLIFALVYLDRRSAAQRTGDTRMIFILIYITYQRSAEAHEIFLRFTGFLQGFRKVFYTTVAADQIGQESACGTRSAKIRVCRVIFEKISQKFVYIGDTLFIGKLYL